MGPRLNFDRIARPYRWLEYLSFGPLLECCRFYRIAEATDCASALVLGDGDGRFISRLLAAASGLHADAADISPAMLGLLRRRVEQAGAAERLRLHCIDIRNFLPDREYDLIVTHFFLDCLTAAEISALVERLRPALLPGALWIVSEFAVPERGLARWLARPLVAALYRAFHLLTGLPVQSLPAYAQVLAEAGFDRTGCCRWLGGLLVSEVWRRG